MSQFDPVQVAFDSAIRDFKDKLHDDDLYREIVQVKSIEEVYDATDKLQQEQSKKGHLRHLSKIEPYLTRIHDYKNAVGVFVQVKPDLLGLIWGPIVLLLQWASILKTSFDAIINTTQEIGQALPEFEQAARLFGQNTHIKDVLLLFFKDILEFYLVAFKFFRLPRWRYVFEALWPKYREKIKVVTRHIGLHSLLLRKEAQFEHIQQEHEARHRSLEHFESVEKAHQLQEYCGIRTEISPRTYDDNLDWLRGRLCSGAGKWLLKDETFIQWLNASDVSVRLMWIHGIPGAGKTFLSCTVVEQAREIPQSRTLFAFISHTLASSTSALSILHSLIFQLTSDNDELQTVLCNTSRENFKSNIEVALEIFSTLLACSGTVFIVIDGVDEMEKIERIRLVTHLINTQAKCEQIRICFSSRLEDDLKALLEKDAASIRVDNRNADCIQEFVRQWSEKWFLEHRIRPKEENEMRKWLEPLPSKSRGMFLYTKVVLSTIEDLDDLDEICNELTVLPETLDAAYGRILSRINRLQHPALKEKARKLLGWIACSPTPLTIQEVQYALSVKLDDREGQIRRLVDLNIGKICGPIVEVVNDYVQFVHFTVKEYIMSPSIDGYIGVMESTLSLTMSCITFLCQKHHDPQLLVDEIRENVMDGTYVLHEYAATTWLDLVEKCVRLDPTETAAPDLVRLLEEISTDRSNLTYVAERGELEKLTMRTFKRIQPQLYEMLSKAAQFRDLCLSSPRASAEVVALDPLTITQTSVLVERATEDLLRCNRTTHDGNCPCNQIREYYGGRPFKCRFSHCHFRRHGFAHRRDRKSHERYHDRPWKCSVSTCEYANGGFLSRKMRDEHFEKSHQVQTSDPVFHLSQPVQHDLQLMVIDLILNANADTLDNMKPAVQEANIDQRSISPILEEIASRGSLCQLRFAQEVLCKSGHRSLYSMAILSAIKSHNEECFEFLVKETIRHVGKFDYPRVSQYFEKVLYSDSIEIYNIWERYAREDIDNCVTKGRNKAMVASGYAAAGLSAATGNLQREQLILNFWNGKGMIEAMDTKYLGSTLAYVAQSCCSVRLATCLIEAGASVDHRNSARYLTPLHHAARKTSAEAAELMKFLLECGADPEIEAGRSERRIRDEKGAKGISKWLGISWDELVEQIKKDRENMQVEQVSSPHLHELE